MAAIIIFSILGIAALTVLIVFVVNTQPQKAEKPREIPADCCGAHAVCMRDNLLTTTDQIIYFDDEELDVLANREPDDFSEEEMATIENIFYTLREQDVAGWLRSLQLRNIKLPEELREAALLIVSERRTHKSAK